MIGMGVGGEDVVGLSDVECVCTLRSVVLSVGVALGIFIGNFGGFSTLGDDVGGFRSFSTLLSVSEIFCRALLVGYPASKLSIVVEGGAVIMATMSVAAYLKK